MWSPSHRGLEAALHLPAAQFQATVRSRVLGPAGNTQLKQDSIIDSPFVNAADQSLLMAASEAVTV